MLWLILGVKTCEVFFRLFTSYYFPWLYCVDLYVASGINFVTSLVSFTGFYTEYEPNFVSGSTFNMFVGFG